MTSKLTDSTAVLAQSTLAYGDLTPTTVPRRFISYEWFKAVLQVTTALRCCWLATGNKPTC